MEEVSTSVTQDFIHALFGAPRYLYGWFVGLLTVILSDFSVTALAVAGLSVGFATHSILIGIATFFVLYALARVVFSVASSIGQVADQLYYIADAFRNPRNG